MGRPWGHIFIFDNWGGRRLGEAERVDRSMERFGRPDFIKLDIEGAEVEALEGATQVLKDARPTSLIELHGPECERGVRRILSEHGYRFFDLDGAAVSEGDRLSHQVVAKAER